jgi:glutaredoxin
MMKPVLVQIYTRRGCRLCDKAKAMIEPFVKSHPLVLETVDIERDPALQREYGEQIPVVFINGRKAFKFRVETGAFLRKLEEAMARS